ncbi:MAG: SH3 domain-containing protein [Treponema sp.]|nr:SH3 domain-containing protein [Treponema sp.]
MPEKRLSLVFLCMLAAVVLICSSCSSKLGWGVLLWSTEEPAISSGTVLPVYIRSNIDKVWVVGVPGAKGYKIEVPLSRLEMMGSRKKANRRAESFAPYALAYAENLQDGLPIRDAPENNARRVYRLRTGEIMKILSRADGQPAIGASGDPLPGDWLKVLTEDGSIGYCFSYRLKVFDYQGGPLVASAPVISENVVDDPNLDMLLSKTWSPETYGAMINYRRLNLEDLSRNWRFDPGQETGIARVYAPGVDRSFSYTGIRAEGARSWRFEGSGLSMQMRSESTIAVQYPESSGGNRTLLFVALPNSVEDLIFQESARRDRLYSAIYSQGPVFTSNNYGTIIFSEEGSFAWNGFDLLVPQYIGAGVQGNGTVAMDLFLSSDLEDRYSGAFTLRFISGGREEALLRCMYFLDNQGFRIEIVPESSIEDIVVTRRAASPMVLYFFMDSGLW